MEKGLNHRARWKILKNLKCYCKISDDIKYMLAQSTFYFVFKLLEL